MEIEDYEYLSLRRFPKAHVYKDDLPKHVLDQIINNEEFHQVSIDTEAMGLNNIRDRLCLVQLCFDAKNCHLIKFNANSPAHSPNLVSLLENKKITKIFHFARFDLALLYHTFGVVAANIYCTKIASKLARTYTERHGFKTLCQELLKIEVSKREQSSDWGRDELTQAQIEYASMDVIYLDLIKQHLDSMLEREGRAHLAYNCFEFLPHLAVLDSSGWSENIFNHL